MRIIAYISILITCSACITSAPRLSPQQLRAIQVRTHTDSTKKNTFQASKEILQDEGYLIRKQDYAGGMLVAEKKRTLRSPNHSGRILEEEVYNKKYCKTSSRSRRGGYSYSFKKGKLIKNSRSRYSPYTGRKCTLIIKHESPEFSIMEQYTFTVNIEELNRKDTKTRIGIERTVSTNKGNQTGNTVVSQPQYLSFYNQLKVELERRKIYNR